MQITFLATSSLDYPSPRGRWLPLAQELVAQGHLARQAAGVTVNTRFLQRRCESLGVPAARLTYVPNGIAAARLAPPDPQRVDGLRAGLGLGAAPVVMYVGTLSQTTHHVRLLL